jgi:hypothetical protein
MAWRRESFGSASYIYDGLVQQVANLKSARSQKQCFFVHTPRRTDSGIHFEPILLDQVQCNCAAGSKSFAWFRSKAAFVDCGHIRRTVESKFSQLFVSEVTNRRWDHFTRILTRQPIEHDVSRNFYFHWI